MYDVCMYVCVCVCVCVFVRKCTHVFKLIVWILFDMFVLVKAYYFMFTCVCLSLCRKFGVVGLRVYIYVRLEV